VASEIVVFFRRHTTNNNLLEQLQQQAGMKITPLRRPPRIRWGMRREMYLSLIVTWDCVYTVLAQKALKVHGRVEKDELAWLWKVLKLMKQFEYVRDVCILYLVFDVIGVCVTKLQAKEKMNVIRVRIVRFSL
jgi:hypothetical protein